MSNIDLKNKANELARLTQLDGIRMYFDDIGIYESSTLFNFFELCEEVAHHIEKGEFEKAEKKILDKAETL